jgi:hypothetical protein
MNLRSACSLVAAILFGFIPLTANADTGISVGPDISSTGLGVSLGYKIPDAPVVVRVESGNFTINPTFNSNGNTYNGHLNLSNILVNAEFHPSGKAFYVAAGGFINNNSISASTTSAGVMIGGFNYGAGTANAKVTWPNLAPFIGIGFAPMHGGFGFDLGAAFQGKATAVVTSTFGAAVSPSDYASAQSQIENTVNTITVYPVIGIRYTFGF